ncbi:PRAME family member 12-like [Peromyscus californicus insignis]|uniref:PRAME family member 12-like n=1 Tax=Peromyscus californicus insignis TaxID=564181 RepID=UPI0022A80A34|nr:PRAME family member 12-like [Peromyscus californicus insignis]
MSLEAPSTLLGLSMKSLLRHEALAISVLQKLPRELFPSLFKEAFKSRHMNILTVMVAEWPFSCLPVGALIQYSDVVILQAVLDGVDMLLKQRVHLRRSKLRVLDLRKVRHVFWDVWPGIECGESSTGTLSKEQKENDLPRYALRQRLKVVTDFYLNVALDKEQAYLLQWAQQQQGAVRLRCPKMIICNTPEQVFVMVLNTFKPYYIEELHLSICWTPRALSRFAHCFGQMRKLCKLHVVRISIYTNKAVYTLEDIEKYTTRFLVQISKLKYLQDLLINDSYFSSEHMKQLFRCLKSPLESLSIKLRKFSPSDLKHLSECQWIFQLKHLTLFSASLFNLCPTALQVLLKSVEDTLQTLQIRHCCIRDSQHSALLPVLSQCLQLTSVNFYDTVISLSVLKDLLQSLANLSKLTEEHYPAPLECYDDRGHVLVNKFANVCLDLLNTIRVKRQPKVIYFATNSCRKCLQRCVFDGKTRLCPCLS